MRCKNQTFNLTTVQPWGLPSGSPPPAVAQPRTEIEDRPAEEDLEIDPEVDPLQDARPSGTIAEWEVAARLIVPRAPLFEDPAEQRQKVQDLLAQIQDVNLWSDPASQAEAEEILASLPQRLRDPESFVAGTFTACHAAWSTLLENSKRKSVKTVLGWLKKGVKPQFVGSGEAKASKLDLVVGMLKRQVPAAEIPFMLSGNKPHSIKFENHKSFYDNSDSPSEKSTN